MSTVTDRNLCTVTIKESIARFTGAVVESRIPDEITGTGLTRKTVPVGVRRTNAGIGGPGPNLS